MRRIENRTNRQVTFSKRRNGLLKKARELGILCDAEVGVIVFSTTGKRYEYATSSMKSIIERYHKYSMKLVEKSQINAPRYDNMWANEVIMMKQELQQLQDNKRRLMGEDLSSLSLKDLNHLEQVLDMSIHRVREKKDEILHGELEELHRKERCLSDENMKWHKMISMVESPTVGGTGNGFSLESINYNEVQGETSEAAISVPNFSLQLNLPDSSESYHVISKSRVATQLW